ncbi:MAG TPA: hypothetical protein OIM35_08515 [Clostridiaceae bacterium]|nr:hypothetical protein [Clostridiaceae bacterium]
MGNNFKIDFSGLEKFQKELNQKVQNFNSKQKTFADIFDSSFMNTYTKFSNIDDFFNNGGFVINSKEDLENINESDLDKYVSNNSTFSSWNEMQKTASVEYAKKQLF